MVALAPSNTDVVYAGALNGDIWVSTNRGSTWRSTAGTAVAPLPVRPVTQIQVDPLNPLIAYATYSGFNSAGQGNGHVFRIIHEHTSAPFGFEDMKAILHRK